ncbi:bifunctional metallophosphatase/5'-nucleotidase [Mangrovibacillus cuniculi]|uniref:Bifunctional metallophosphatase/5'-nucleotidase n=1 Tax=Mangrovibacillus cuniculi TaxID=2593652 RepID=A0A7S8CD74_9BACI|nr:5'-nucleotidase C-terminal domain-containing protein [Mangrovibacillus cuniculi]QPC47815.1 bifunctional metallophosphatase/5'-nucleotidase [Mangrovibacillus cuniculi]
MSIFTNKKLLHVTLSTILATTAVISISPSVSFAKKDQQETQKKTPPGKASFTLSLLHTNDIHARTEQFPKLVTAVKEARKQNPHSLLLDAGDVFSGTLYFNEFKGQADLKFMNLMGYDVMTLGNHEFDLGNDEEGNKALAEFIEAAKFAFVSSNVDFSNDQALQGLFSDTISSKPKDGKIYQGMVKKVKGEKIGFFGLTTQETADIASPGKVQFENYIEEAKKAVKAFEDMGVNKIVAVTHIGYNDNPNVDNDILLAQNVPGIDVIVGGHSHDKLTEPVVIDADKDGKVKDKTLIVQAYQYGDFLGSLDVSFNSAGEVVSHKGKLIETATFADDKKALKILKPYQDKIKEIESTETGATAINALENPRQGNGSTTSVRSNETTLGNVITDGMLAKAQQYDSNVIMALQNGGGIRNSIDAGPITVGEVISVLPFGNTLATMQLTGKELKEAFEISFKNVPGENGGFLHVSGAKVVYDSTKPVNSRVVSIAYKDTNGQYVSIKDEETYKVATNAFTAKGGDGYTVFANAYKEGRVTDLGLSDWENFAEHLRNVKTVNPSIEGRIVDVVNLPSTVTPEEFNGTPEEVKVFYKDITVLATQDEDVILQHAHIKGNLFIKGTANVTMENVEVDGDTEFLD